MAEITASMVKTLREETGLGMMDCKKALQEADGDMDAARDDLRAKGLATAEKKSGRATSEGLIAIEFADDGTAATMIEVVCETDFCARNDEFTQMVQDVARMAAEADAGDVPAGEKIADRVQQTLAKIGENMSYARGVKIEAPRIGTYIHHNGKVGVLLGAEGEISDQTLSDLCMHIAFADPMGLTAEDIPAEILTKERQIAKQQAIASGKPEHIAEKMVEGKVKKFVSEKALLEQPFVKDDKKSVKEVLGVATITAFARFAVGEAAS